MSYPYAAIRSAFVQKLQTFPSLPPVAWENVPFVPAPGVSFLRPYLMPAEPSQAELGSNGQNVHVGIYQISVWTPSGVGVSDMQALCAALVDFFKRGTALAYMGQTVNITRAFPGPMIQETDWIHTPVSIFYRAYAPN